MEAILDTNFIISCVRDKIDFISQLKENGFRIIVPREVLQELKDIKERSGESRDDRTAIAVALEIIEKSKIRKVGIGDGKVDHELIKRGVNGAYIATLDKEIKRRVPNRIVIDSAKKAIMVERD